MLIAIDKVNFINKFWGFELMSTRFKTNQFSVYLVKIIFVNLFYYSAYFYYYLWVLMHFLVLFIDLTILFHLIFTFIYNTFKKKFLVSVKYNYRHL